MRSRFFFNSINSLATLLTNTPRATVVDTNLSHFVVSAFTSKHGLRVTFLAFRGSIAANSVFFL